MYNRLTFKKILFFHNYQMAEAGLLRVSKKEEKASTVKMKPSSSQFSLLIAKSSDSRSLFQNRFFQEVNSQFSLRPAHERNSYSSSFCFM